MKNGFKVVDADLHVMEPLNLWEKRLPAPYRSLTTLQAPGGMDDVGNWQFQVGELSISSRDKSRFVNAQANRRWKTDPEAQNMMEFSKNPTPKLLLEGMAAEGMDVATLIPTISFILLSNDGIHPEHATAICRAYNDWAAEFCAAAPERFKFWGWLPRQDAVLAAEESRRCVKELGAIGVATTLGATDGRLLSDPFFEPLWAEVSELAVPFGLHVFGRQKGLRDEITSRFWGQPHGEGPAVALHCVLHGMGAVCELTYGGVLERYPTLRTVIMEAGNTWLLFLLDQLDEKWEKYEPEFKELFDVELSMKPSDYFRRQCFVTCEGEERGLKYLVGDYGLENNILFSTDYPHHDAAWPHAVEHLLQQPISDDAKRKILWDNTAKAFGWSAAVEAVAAK
jgi:predicted TIM-barrel fold metal-dependent hydrolase